MACHIQIRQTEQTIFPQAIVSEACTSLYITLRVNSKELLTPRNRNEKFK